MFKTSTVDDERNNSNVVPNYVEPALNFFPKQYP